MLKCFARCEKRQYTVSSIWNAEKQAKNRRLLKNSYCRDYLEYICVDEMGSLLLSNGISIKQIRIWLGHSTFFHHRGYLRRLDFSAQEQSAAAMSGMFQRKSVSAG